MTYDEQKEMFCMACTIYELLQAGGTITLKERVSFSSGTSTVRDWVFDFLGCAPDEDLVLMERVYCFDKHACRAAGLAMRRFWDKVDGKGLIEDGLAIQRIFV